MKRTNVFVAGLVLACGSVAMASGLNIKVVAPDFEGSSDVTVGTTCGTLNYQVIVELDDALNQGLALVGFDLTFSGGALDQATAPASMNSFVKPEGLTNPAGYGGTLDGGVLLQVGGGQNTIMNGQVPCTSAADCPAGSACGGSGLCDPVAPFPVGTVVTGLAMPGSEQIVAEGSLTLPVAEGGYSLTASELFANVITETTTGVPFWATAAATPGTNTVLNITVQEGAECNSSNSICSSVPASGSIDARQPHLVDNASAVAGWDSVEVVMCNASVTSDASAFSLSEVGGDGTAPAISSATVIAADTVRLDFDRPIDPGAWTVVTHNASGTTACLGFLPADADQNGLASAGDINNLINSINGVPGFELPSFATDIDRGGVTNSQDILRLIDLLNGAGEFDVWLAATLGPNPCAAP